jgi:hypothetical protein
LAVADRQLDRWEPEIVLADLPGHVLRARRRVRRQITLAVAQASAMVTPDSSTLGSCFGLTDDRPEHAPVQPGNASRTIPSGARQEVRIVDLACGSLACLSLWARRRVATNARKRGVPAPFLHRSARQEGDLDKIAVGRARMGSPAVSSATMSPIPEQLTVICCRTYLRGGQHDKATFAERAQAAL